MIRVLYKLDHKYPCKHLIYKDIFCWIQDRFLIYPVAENACELKNKPTNG